MAFSFVFTFENLQVFVKKGQFYAGEFTVPVPGIIVLDVGMSVFNSGFLLIIGTEVIDL